MAPLKLPLQVSCPNCQAGNLPGSPYCSRCGAPLVEVPVGPPPVIKPTTPPEDPIKNLTKEGQDPILVRQTYDRASAIMTTGETIEYIAVSPRGCVVATTKRLMLYRKKLMGKFELDDCYWRDVRAATMKDGKGGITLTLDAIQGWHLTIEALPKAQAWRVYEVALEHNERLREESEKSAPAVSAPVVPVGPTSPQVVLASEMPAQANTPPIVPLPVRSAVVSPPATATSTSVRPAAHLSSVADSSDRPGTPVGPSLASSAANPSVYGFVPTPESVLQSILQHSQDVGNGGEPTRPMQFAAAAFQAPALADAQPVTFRDTNSDTDPRLRSGPPLTTLEQIAIFSGPLNFNQSQVDGSSPPLTPYSRPISGPLSRPDTDRLASGALEKPNTDRLASGSLTSSPRLTSGTLPSAPNNSAAVPLDGASVQTPQASFPPHVEPKALPDSAQVFGALPSGLLAGLPNTSTTLTAFTPEELREEPSNGLAVQEAITPMEVIDILSIMQPTAPMLVSGPLPMPGSMTSGPLLAATSQMGAATGASHDSGSLATQHLYLEADSDSDRPTDINLGEYNVQPQASTRNSKSSGAGKAGTNSSPSRTATAASARSNGSNGGKTSGDDPISKMKQLKMLLDAGFITEADYEAKKADILARFF